MVVASGRDVAPVGTEYVNADNRNQISFYCRQHCPLQMGHILQMAATLLRKENNCHTSYSTIYRFSFQS